jgi:hypothetical protein
MSPAAVSVPIYLEVIKVDFFKKNHVARSYFSYPSTLAG